MSLKDRREIIIPLLVFVAGIALAFEYRELNASPGESGQAAMALLEHGYIGDPYMLPSGPTAHVSPLVASFLAMTYAAFGTNSPTARVVLGITAATLYALGIRAVLRLCVINRCAPAAIGAVVALLLATSTFLFEAVVYYRQWDQPFSALVLIESFLVARTAGTDTRHYRPTLKLSVLGGVGGLLSPSLLPTIVSALAILTWHRRAREDWRLSASMSVAVLALFLLPWGIRNQAQMGSFILTRSNFGLELATGNAAGAEGYSGSGTGASLHPHDSIAAARRVVAVGELAYMREMSAEARSWIAAHPRRFATLTLKRIILTFFPTRSMVGWVPAVGTFLPWAALLIFGALKLISLFFASASFSRACDAVLFMVLPLASYFITHVNLRYEFVTYFTSLVIIASFFDRLARRLAPVAGTGFEQAARRN